MKYKKYPSYKDSGVEWLGEIPSDWNIATVARLFDLKAGGDLKKDYFSEEKSKEYKYPIYTNTTVSKKNYGYTCKPIFKSNTITVTGRGDVGYAVYRDHEYDAIIRLLVLSPKNKQICKFFMYYINGVLDFNVGNTAISQLSTEQITPYHLVVPSFQEQFLITNFLDNATQKMDTLIQKQENLIKLLKEKRQAVISHAVTRGLNPDVKFKDSGVEWLGEVPEHWEVSKLKFLCSITTGGKDTENKIDDGEYPFYVRSQTVERINSYSYNGEAILTAGDGVGVGKVFHYVNGKFDFHQRVYMFYKFRKMEGQFLFEYIKNNFYKVALAGMAKSTVDSLRLPLIQSFMITVPPIHEQQDIVDYLNDKTQKIDKLIKKATKSIKLLKEKRTALISAAVTGKIDVRELI